MGRRLTKLTQEHMLENQEEDQPWMICTNTQTCPTIIENVWYLNKLIWKMHKQVNGVHLCLDLPCLLCLFSSWTSSLSLIFFQPLCLVLSVCLFYIPIKTMKPTSSICFTGRVMQLQQAWTKCTAMHTSPHCLSLCIHVPPSFIHRFLSITCTVTRV